ncbi:SMI1/KNR4 family protein [Streptomyces collinus]|uniref:SMI1/KNR4 family protein n=1 Tax=Streptomyces collinus TaxID=42684 RepID=UPI0033DF1282
MWVDSLLRATGWNARDVAQPWAEIETELGTELPGDYKELCQAFGAGEFSQEVSVLCADETRVGDLLICWRGLLESDDDADGPWVPYRIHEPGTTGGLIPWGTTRSADRFFWQVTDGPVDAWPVLAVQVDTMEWNRYEMTATQFLYRFLTDPGFSFWPYSVAEAMSGTVAQGVPEPFFEPA